MRIAMFTNNYKPYIGGVPISIEHLAAALRERGHEVYVFAPTYKEQKEEPYVIRYPSFPMSIAKAPVPDVLTRLFEKKVRELDIELIHVHHPAIVGNMALYLKKKYGLPVVFTYHTRYEQYLHYVKPLERIERYTGVIEKYLEYFCRKCDMVIAPTPGIREYLLKRNPTARVRVMPTGIPRSSFLPDFEKVKMLQGRYRTDVDYLFLTVSRLAKEKNLIFQLEGLSLLKERLQKKGRAFRHLIIGEGPQRKELEEKIRQLGLEENVVLAGNVPNQEMKDYQAAADAFLFTSKSETQGIVVLEAMAAGNPVVAVDATGVRDVVENGVNGFLCPENAADWADGVCRLLADPETYRAMSREACVIARQYSQESMSGLAESYYQEICGKTSTKKPFYGILSV